MVERFSIEKHTSAPGEYINPDLHKVITENNWICPFEMTDKSEGYYSLKYNKIVLPKMELCTDKKDFYDKALNAMAHSTGQRSALNRFSEAGIVNSTQRKNSLQSYLLHT